MAIVLNYIFLVWVIYVLHMFLVLWGQLMWKWGKSIFLYLLRIQWSLELFISYSSVYGGLWTWKGKRKVLKSQFLIELLMKSEKVSI